MITQHSTKVTNSFVEWLDHKLVYDGRAYVNTTGQFFEYDDSELPSNYNTFSAPYKQFVYNSAATGAIIFSGLSTSSAGFVSSAHVSGVYLDYAEGRLIVPESIVADGSTATGAYAYKEFNVYLVSERDEEMIFANTQFVSDSRYKHKTSAANIPYSYYAPACFVVPQNSQNVPFSFGGQVNSVFRYRVVVVAASQYQLEACLSLLRDQSNKNMCLLNPSQLPLNEYGDIKGIFSGSYNYLNQIASASEMVFINSISTAFMGNLSREQSDPSRYIGFADFELSSVRFTN